MSSALNVAPALQAALYFDNLSLPRTVADVTSSLRHVVYGSPTLVVCVIINALMVYYVLSFFTARVGVYLFTRELYCLLCCRFRTPKSVILIILAPYMGLSVF